VTGTAFELANHVPALALTVAGYAGYGRVHRLDQLNAFIPANLFDFRSLTQKAASKTDWPV
jgi:hypothetical protein